MIRHKSQKIVTAEHLDAGNHANWRAQLHIAESAHFELRNLHGFDLEQLRTHGLFLVIKSVNSADYIQQLRLGDVLEVNTAMWVSSRCTIEVIVEFRKDGKVATQLRWVMAMTSSVTDKLCRIPQWLIEAVGHQQE